MLFAPLPVVLESGLNPAILDSSPLLSSVQSGMVQASDSSRPVWVRKKQVEAVALVQQELAVVFVQEADWPADNLLDMEQPSGREEEEGCVTLTLPPVPLPEALPDDDDADAEDEDEEADALAEEDCVALLS